jgi:hypothetical protein
MVRDLVMQAARSTSGTAREAQRRGMGVTHPQFGHIFQTNSSPRRFLTPSAN